jgi:hypothetical protein
MRAYVRLDLPPKLAERIAPRMRALGYEAADAGAGTLMTWLPMDPDGWGILPAMSDLECELFGTPNGPFINATVVHTDEGA